MEVGAFLTSVESEQAFEESWPDGNVLVHAHIATIPGRLPPAADEHHLTVFFKTLIQAYYDQRISVEARVGDLLNELLRALPWKSSEQV
jgi:hypothetical protein